MYTKPKTAFLTDEMVDISRNSRMHTESENDRSNSSYERYVCVLSLARLGCSMGNTVVKCACHTCLIPFTTTFRDSQPYILAMMAPEKI